MTVAPPPGSSPNYSRGVVYVVLLGPDDGSWPTKDDEVDFLVPLRFHHSIGGQRIDSITLRWDLALSGDRLVDTTTPVGYDRIVDVHAWNPSDGTTRRVAWGKISDQDQSFDSTRESVTVTARVEPWLIGEYRTSGHYIRHTNGSLQMIDQPIVFNPEVDGRLQGNRSSVKVTSFPGIEPVSVWLHPGSTMSAPARTQQAQLERLWSLADAVHTLCHMLNPNETFVANPAFDDLVAFFTLDYVDDFELLRNQELDSNLWLGEALDQLLEPFGFAWHLTHDDSIPTVGTDKQHARLAFLQRNVGPLVDVYATRPTTPKTVVTRDNLNVANFHAAISIAGLVNEINAVSDPVDIESTYELIPAWPEASDTDLTVSDLLDSNNRIKGDEGLTWILNEAGDLNGLRTGITAATPLDALMNEDHPEDGARTLTIRRRRFLPALTKGEDGKPIGAKGFHLEWRPKYHDGTSVVTADWQTVDWPFHVLADQCGVAFTGEINPRLLQMVKDYPDHKALRITATIASDFGRRVQAVKRPESPNADTIRLEARLPRRFRVRRVSTNSRWYTDRHEDVLTLAAGTSTTVVEIAGDTHPIAEGDRITITDSTAIDGVYTVSAVATNNSNTQLTLDAVLDDSTVDGTVGWLTDEIDDTRQLQEYVEHLRDIDDAADVSVSITLHGTDHEEYQLGRLVQKVAGRELTLNANAPTEPERYPQIIGYNVELTGEPSTELVLENTRVERFDFRREP